MTSSPSITTITFEPARTSSTEPTRTSTPLRLRAAPERAAHHAAVDPRRTRVMQRAEDRAQHRNHLAGRVGADLGRARRALGHPLPGRHVGLTGCELQDPAAGPAVVGIELRDQRLVVTAGREHEIDPARPVPLGRLGREDPGARGRGPARVGPIDEQRPRPRSAELVRGRGADDSAADHHCVVPALRHALIFAHGAGRYPIVRRPRVSVRSFGGTTAKVVGRTVGRGVMETDDEKTGDENAPDVVDADRSGQPRAGSHHRAARSRRAATKSHCRSSERWPS